MNSLKMLVLGLACLSTSCSPETNSNEAGEDSSPDSSNNVQSPAISPASSVSPFNTMAENFNNTPLYFSNGLVQTKTNSQAELELATIAQQAVTTTGIAVSEGARVLVFDELEINRVIIEIINRPDDTTGRDARTVILDKNSGAMKNVFLGYTLETPPESLERSK